MSFVSFAIVTDWSPIRSRWIELWRTASTSRRSVRDGCLERERLLDELLDAVVAVVDLVVERDHLVAELGVLRLERVERAAHGAEHDLALLLQARLEAVEPLLVLELSSEPPRHVVLGALVGRLREDLRRRVVLDEDPVPALAVLVHLDARRTPSCRRRAPPAACCA